MTFFWRVIQWIDGVILGGRWTGETCFACHKKHPIGLGYFSCPKETLAEKEE